MLCDDCIFRAGADGFRCVAKISAEPVGECWGYIRREEGDQKDDRKNDQKGTKR